MAVGTKSQRVEQGNVNTYELATDPKESFSSLTTQVYNTNVVAGRLYLLFHF